MKHIKFVIFFISAIMVFLIYYATEKKQINYLALGDGIAKGETPLETYGESYTDYVYKYLSSKKETNNNFKTFTKSDYRITDLINDINSVETIKKQENLTITHLLKKADIITISIGSDELFYKLKQYNDNIKIGNKQKIIAYIDEMFNDIKNLLNTIRKYTNSPIIFVGYYNPIPMSSTNSTIIDSIFNYIDLKFNEIIDKNFYYLDIYHIFKNHDSYLPNKNNVFPTLEGYNLISNEIIKLIEKENIVNF